MKAVAVAGHRKSGKTTLVEGLLRTIPAEYHVATVKSIHHDVEFDATGTDTYRHRSAGADTIVGVTPSLSATFRMAGKDDGVELSDQLERLEATGADWAIVEGFKSASIPTILVGDLDPEAVGGPILVRVADGTTADPEGIWEQIESVPDWHADPTT